MGTSSHYFPVPWLTCRRQGSLCTCAFIYAYFLIPETKGLTLEQVDRMLEETTPRTSVGWVPRTTYAEDYAREKEHVEHDV